TASRGPAAHDPRAAPRRGPKRLGFLAPRAGCPEAAPASGVGLAVDGVSQRVVGPRRVEPHAAEPRSPELARIRDPRPPRRACLARRPLEAAGARGVPVLPALPVLDQERRYRNPGESGDAPAADRDGAPVDRLPERAVVILEAVEVAPPVVVAHEQQQLRV